VPVVLKNAIFCELPFGRSFGLLTELKALFCTVLRGASVAFHGSTLQPAYQIQHKHSLDGSRLTDQDSCYKILHSTLL